MHYNICCTCGGDLMKYVDFDDYSKQQMFKLYNDALFNKIKDSRLSRIKGALHKVVYLGIYNRNSFEYLINALLSLSDSALLDILSGNFNNFYNAYYSYYGHITGMPRDFYMISYLLRGIYTDYSNVLIDDYSWLCNYCMPYLYDIPSFKDPDVDTCLATANYDLSELLKITHNNIDYELIDTKRFSFDDKIKIDNLKTHLLVTFLMNINNYDHQYKMPTDLFNLLIKEIDEDDIIRLGKFLNNSPNNYNFAKRILDEYHSNYDNISLNDKIKHLALLPNDHNNK